MAHQQQMRRKKKEDKWKFEKYMGCEGLEVEEEKWQTSADKEEVAEEQKKKNCAQ